MNLQERIKHLRQEHQRLHELIEKMPTIADRPVMQELKKKKLAVKDELTDLIDADTYQGGVENFAVYHKA